MGTERGTLNISEAHPSCEIAINYLRGRNLNDLYTYQAAYSSCAIEGNRLAEICSETLHRLFNDLPVSDRYLLGLVVEIMSDEINKLKEKLNGKEERDLLRGKPTTTKRRGKKK